ncbi:AAA-type ATPase N-terminal domain [Arabidopsis suecica]|uniref:AAA-type ATPase N-terminal domain n=1 Tax=Arabidopsis suecica TaxID=45249 RepID=A0A8T2FF14_ARASU|nr:AAA-type ATPase N-terminal domain [Arabidopsis suecica]
MSSSSESHLATAKTALTAVASVAAAAILARSVVQDYMPNEVHEYISHGFRRFFSYFSYQMTAVIEEFGGFEHNQVFEAAEAYLSTKISNSTRRIKVNKLEKQSNYSVTVERDEEVLNFDGVLIGFRNPRDLNSTLKSEVRSYELSFRKKFKNMVLESYLPFVVEQAASIKQKFKTLKIFTVDSYSVEWTSVTLDHPSTFRTLALDPEVKKNLVEDLDRFVQRKGFYGRVGKAWKRGYLLYGPPGTGKSSLIAAIANHLNFDIYDLDLTSLNNNAELRRLLMSTANRSILVVEDIDCSIELKDRSTDQENNDPLHKTVTLSGLLNFVDGLWSSCGNERIIVFTTNYREKLDPALLRPGRMDMHIHMLYCTPAAFKVLASNYLEIQDHILFEQIEEFIREIEVTPAEVAEQLMRSDSVDKVLQGLVEFLKAKKQINNSKA